MGVDVAAVDIFVAYFAYFAYFAVAVELSVDSVVEAVDSSSIDSTPTDSTDFWKCKEEIYYFDICCYSSESCSAKQRSLYIFSPC